MCRDLVDLFAFNFNVVYSPHKLSFLSWSLKLKKDIYYVCYLVWDFDITALFKMPEKKLSPFILETDIFQSLTSNIVDTFEAIER